MNASRPETLDEFIGQSRVVDSLRVACKAALTENRPLPHMVFSGPPGLGKTTLAAALADEMDGKLVSRIASVIRKPEDMLSLFAEVDRPNTLIFIDEVEQLSRPMTELLHTALEDGRLTVKLKDGRVVEVELPEFTMIIATNYAGELPKPFFDRFPLKHTFETYDEYDVVCMLSQVADGKRNWHVAITALEKIAARSFGTPRVALGYLERAHDLSVADERFHRSGPRLEPVINVECVEETFKLMGIDEQGLDTLDRKVLGYLRTADRAVGLEALAEAVYEDRSAVRLSESKLVRLGLMMRTPGGRVLTAEGRRRMGPPAVFGGEVSSSCA